APTATCAPPTTRKPRSSPASAASRSSASTSARRSAAPAREGHRGGEPAVDRQGLPVHVRGLVARQEERGVRDLLGQAVALQRIELAELVGRAAGTGVVEDRLG